MAYSKFKTEKADYIIDFGNHVTRLTNIEILKEIDALILEPRTEIGKILDEGAQKDNAELIEYCASNQVPIYFVDVELTLYGMIIDTIKIIGELPILALILPYLFSKQELRGMNKMLSKLVSDLTYFYKTIGNEGRNAVCARKIEEYLVPMIAKNKRKRPRIGIHVGAGHAGLEYDLGSKGRRDSTLDKFRDPNSGRYAGFDLIGLDKVYEANFNGKKWEIKQYRTGLFGQIKK